MQELLRRVLKVWEKRLPLTPAPLQALGEEAYARGWGLAGIWEQKFLERIQGSLTTAIAKGSTYSEWTQNEGQKILDAFGAGVSTYKGGKRWDPWYSELVMRNATQASFAGGRYSAMWAPEWQKVAPFWRYYATLDDRTRPEHSALHGKVFRKDDAAARAFLPPWGHACRCQAQELTLAEVEDAGYQISDGNRVPLMPIEGGGTIGRPPGGWDIDRVTANSSRVLKQATKAPAALPPAAPPAPPPAPKPVPRPAPAPPPPAPPAKGPAGPRVSSHVRVASPASRAKAQRILGLIDSVHGDGTLSPTEIHFLPGGNGFWRPGKIKVGKAAPHWAVQQVHEIGHWLDYQGLSPGKLIPASRTLVLEDVMKAIRASDSYSKLMAQPMRARDKVYLLKPQELWARAYSQYIAEETGDQEMLDQIALWRSGKAAGRNPHGQWDSLDFAPIRAEISKLMRKSGWQT